MESIEKKTDTSVESYEEKLKRAKDFSLFDFTYEEKNKAEFLKTKELESFDTYYAPFNEFINQAYLKGLELNDSAFIDSINAVFVGTHHSGAKSLRDYLIAVEPEVKVFFEKYGTQFFDIGGRATEQYKKWVCKTKLSE